MLVDCPTCVALVNGMVLWSGPGEHFPHHPDPFVGCVLKCPSCGKVIFAAQVGESPLERLWPPPEERWAIGAPSRVNDSLKEAEKCLRAGAFQACAVMVGRAIEGVCRHFGTKDVGLGNGIRELKEMGILDERLFRWAKELQAARNTAAHAGEVDVGERDARDLLNFAFAICHYVFELEQRFEEFMARRKRAAPQTREEDASESS